MDIDRGYDGRVADLRVLENDDLRRLAPAVFAPAPHATRSERYGYVPTVRVIDALRDDGWRPYAARQQAVRTDDRQGYQKHMVRFRHESWSKDGARVQDEINEMIVVNSHDGSSSYELLNGMFRLVCLNGLIVSNGALTRLRIPHSGAAMDNVVLQARAILDRAGRIAETMDRMKAIALHPDEQLAFATSAAELRFAGTEIEPASMAGRLNQARRPADAGADLWRTFNRVQENAMKGGLATLRIETDGRRRRGKTRPIGSIDLDLTLNAGLWALADGTLAEKENA